MSFHVSNEQWSGESVVVLHGPAGAKATILLWGANLIELVLPTGTNAPAASLLAQPPDMASLVAASTRYGSPVLYPFPSRVAQGRFSFGSKHYQLEVYPDGNARHGFAHSREFSVIDRGAGDDGAWVTLTLNGNTADIQKQFPFPFQLSLTFRLDKQGLAIDVAGKNTGGTTMPVGFGWHPYFNMPLAAGGNRSDCKLQVPANQYWELGPDLVPSGRTLEVYGNLDMRTGLTVGENLYDHILTDVIRDEYGWSHAALIDTAAGLKATISAGPSFREWVIYTPPERGAVCLEPYTCTGNAFNLQAAGYDAGVMVLAPGSSWHDTMRMSLATV